MKKVGSGITEREKPKMVPASPERLKAFFDRHNETIHEPWGGLGLVIEAARERLRQIKAEAPSIHDDLAGYNAAFVERVTEGWYLDSIYIEARVAELSVEGGRPWEAFACAMRIGELLTELRMKKLWEPHAVRGKKISDDLEQTRSVSNDRRHKLAAAVWAGWNTRAAEVWDRNPSWKKKAVAHRVKLDLQLTESVETIRKRLKKPGEAG